MSLTGLARRSSNFSHGMIFDLIFESEMLFYSKRDIAKFGVALGTVLMIKVPQSTISNCSSLGTR